MTLLASTAWTNGRRATNHGSSQCCAVTIVLHLLMCGLVTLPNCPHAWQPIVLDERRSRHQSRSHEFVGDTGTSHDAYESTWRKAQDVSTNQANKRAAMALWVSGSLGHVGMETSATNVLVALVIILQPEAKLSVLLQLLCQTLKCRLGPVPCLKSNSRKTNVDWRASDLYMRNLWW